MKRKLLSLFLILCMVLPLMPTTLAYAASYVSEGTYVSGIDYSCVDSSASDLTGSVECDYVETRTGYPSEGRIRLEQSYYLNVPINSDDFMVTFNLSDAATGMALNLDDPYYYNTDTGEYIYLESDEYAFNSSTNILTLTDWNGYNTSFMFSLTDYKEMISLMIYSEGIIGAADECMVTVKNPLEGLSTDVPASADTETIQFYCFASGNHTVDFDNITYSFARGDGEASTGIILDANTGIMTLDDSVVPGFVVVTATYGITGTTGYQYLVISDTDKYGYTAYVYDSDNYGKLPECLVTLTKEDATVHTATSLSDGFVWINNITDYDGNVTITGAKTGYQLDNTENYTAYKCSTTSYVNMVIPEVVLSDDAGITSILSKDITAGSETGTSADPITASINVVNSVSAVSATDIVGATDSTVDFYGIDSTFTTVEAGSVALTAGDTTTIYIKVTAQDGITVSYYAVGIARAAGISNSYFLITKSAPSNSGTETSYYYVYAGTSETSLSPFTGSNADSDTSKAYSIVDKAITDINASAASSAMLHFAATGTTLENASGSLDTINRKILLTSGTYTIKGAIKTTANMGGSGLLALDGASVIIDGATIDSADHGIRNTGDGNITVNSGTITSSIDAITVEDGSVTVNGGTISGTSSAICSSGTGNVEINDGIITSGCNVISLPDNSSGNLTINGGTISSSGTTNGEAINFESSGDLTITAGKIYSLADIAVDYYGTGSLIISGDLWDDTTQTGTLLASDSSEHMASALLVGLNTTNAEIRGGTLLATNVALYAKSDITISGGLIKTTSNNEAALFNENSTVTITGGTITSNNPNTNLDTTDSDNIKFPGTIFLANVGTTAKLYISGGTITNTAATGYAIANYFVISDDSYIYLSDTPTITGNTATLYSFNSIYANDGNGTYYTGSPVSIYYSDDIIAGSTVAVSGVNPDTNGSLFSLKNDGYLLQLSGTDLVINEISGSNLSSILSQSITGGSEAGTSADPITASINVANSVSAVAATDIVGATDSTVEFYGTDSTFTTAEAGSVALTAGSSTNVYVKVTAQDGVTVAYYAVEITRADAIASSDSNLTTVLGKTISTAGSEAGTSADPITESISVANSVSVVSVTDIVGATDSTVIFYGEDSTFTTAEAGSVALTAGNTTTVYIKVTAQDGVTISYYKVGVTRAAATSSGGSSDGNTYPTPPYQGTVVVIVNGETQNAGKKTTTTIDGKTTVIVEFDNKVIEDKINEAINNNIPGTHNVIQVLVADTKACVARVELTGDIVKKLESNTFNVSVKWDNIEYIIPAEEFTISKVAENLGVSENDLGDIKVEVQITKLDQNVVDKYNEVAKANGAELVFPPVAFEVVAKTIKADGATGEFEISRFSNYVERVMEIPAGVDPGKITTGIVFNPDGTYSHVPTEVFQKDGKWYAKLNSLTNSNYSVVWNPVAVKSVENHWSKDAVNDMASRLVIFDTEKFEPDKAITRADFAEYIVRALGLYREGSEHENKFSDLSTNGDRTLAILIASEYGIVIGYPDGTFRPEEPITREEAMTMYQRAMKITKLEGTDDDRYQSYTDYEQVGSWATPYVQAVLSAHVFNGTTATTISPKSNLTYAEAAQSIKNLLVESKLINK